MSKVSGSNVAPLILRLAELLAISAKGKRAPFVVRQGDIDGRHRHRDLSGRWTTFEICNFCGEREMRNSVGLGPEP